MPLDTCLRFQVSAREQHDISKLYQFMMLKFLQQHLEYIKHLKNLVFYHFMLNLYPNLLT